jgi:dipeptide/tripeptide permease
MHLSSNYSPSIVEARHNRQSSEKMVDFKLYSTYYMGKYIGSFSTLFLFNYLKRSFSFSFSFSSYYGYAFGLRVINSVLKMILTATESHKF